MKSNSTKARYRLISFCFLVMVTTLVAGTVNALACSCLALSPTNSVDNADAVFVGKITKEITKQREWGVVVSSVIKGEVKLNIRLVAAHPDSSYEISNFKVNETYVFFSYLNSRERLEASYSSYSSSPDRLRLVGSFEPVVCSWTGPASFWMTKKGKKTLKEQEDTTFLKVLKSGVKPTN